MTRSFVCLSFGAAFVAVLGLSFVQAQEEKGRRNRGPFGRGPGGGGILGLLERPELQAYLKITDDEKAYIKLLQDDMEEKQREFVGSVQGLSQEESRDKFREFFTKRNTEVDEQLKEIIKEEKLARLKQVQMQVQGMGAAFGFGDRAVAEKLAITDEQREKAGEVFRGGFEGMREAFQSAGDDPEARAKVMADLRKKQEEKIAAILTDEQKAKFKELAGEPVGDELLAKLRQPREGDGPPRRREERKKVDN